MSADLPVDPSDDPRLHTDHVRHLPGDGDANAVTLLGVVHDHPASRYRVHELVAALGPEVLAVEVAPLALGLFEGYAADGRDLPAFGGEVSAAIAATEGRVVGIDGVDAGFLAALAGAVLAERPDPTTLSRVVGSVLDAVRDAAVYRVGAALTALTGLRLDVDDAVPHETTLADPPEVQAEDERTQLSRSLTLLRCAEPPAPIRLRDDVRDRCMARRLATLRTEGDVVAVVGRGHLDPLAERLGSDPA